MRKIFILTRDVDYFGTPMYKGTVFAQGVKDKDFYVCHSHEGNLCPSQNLHFTFVHWNPEYFFEVPAISASWIKTILNKQEK